MRFLLVSRAFPYPSSPAVHGVFKRLTTFIAAMSRLGTIQALFYVRPGTDVSPGAVARARERIARDWNTHLDLSLCPLEPDVDRGTRWEAYGDSALSIFRQTRYRPLCGARQVGALLACLERSPDAVLAHRLDGMCPILRARAPLPPVYFDLDDIEHIAFIRAVRWQPPWWVGKNLCYLQLPALLWAERRAMRLAARTFVCSEADRHYLTRLYRLPRVVSVPNAVKLPEYSAPSREPTFLFIGRYTHDPNIQAASFLVNEVWPLIRASVPGAKLIVAGEYSEHVPRPRTPSHGIEFMGFAPDLDGLYARVNVVCSPILSGAGTRVKILEAAAYGKPVVSTTLGAEGLSLRDGHDILLRDGASAFARACVELVRNPQLARHIGLAARRTVERLYERDAIVRQIESELRPKTPAGSPTERLSQLSDVARRAAGRTLR